MSEQGIPMDQNLENQLAGPGGQFPGTAETLATPVGSDKPVRVKIGQADNRHLQLSEDEYRARSAVQKEIDAQTDSTTDPTQEPQMNSSSVQNSPPSLPHLNPPLPKPPRKKKHGPPNGPGSRPKPAGAKQEKLIGQPYPAPSTTKTPAPPVPTNAAQLVTDDLSDRMSRLERGMDMIVRHIAQRDERQTQAPDPDVDQTLVGELDDEGNVYDPGDELADDALDPGESSDAPSLVVVATEDEPEPAPELDAGLQALQQMILKRNPQKVFRQYWCQLSRAAQYNEWPPERREAFDEVFNSMVAHPKFVHQMSKFLRGSRSGNCIGNEQIARVCGMVAGFLTVYQLAAAGR